jgi:polyketide biosynthesis enoyl-CoA hydratase PksH
MDYQTIKVRFEDPVCFLQFYRPEADNTINNRMIDECGQVLEQCEESITIVVLEGLPGVFCFGADFAGIQRRVSEEERPFRNDPEPLYDLWMRLAAGPFITIAHVRGKANAGGVGFVAASDIVLADLKAQFSLSELLFGLFPACVLPFLIRRTGFQKAHYMTLMTQPVPVQQAQAWGLVDAFGEPSEELLRRHLLRLQRLSKAGVRRYKKYMCGLNDLLISAKLPALAANREIFSDPRNLEGICRFVETGQFPWDQ